MEPDQETKLTKELKLEHWGPGPWIDEPDVIKFEHQGYKCLVYRKAEWDGANLDHLFGGHLCGYVRIGKEHPFFGKTVEELGFINVHCGVTFSAFDEQWQLIGFDCAHSGDVVPSMEKYMKECWEKYSNLYGQNHPNFMSPTYKDISFVTEECKSLADQLKAAEAL